jgi:hypothetical protein
MRVTASDPEARDLVVYYWTGETMECLGNACAVDTDEKWVEIFVLGPGSKCMLLNGEPVKVKLYIDYFVRNKRTNSVMRPDGTFIEVRTKGDGFISEVTANG